MLLCRRVRLLHRGMGDFRSPMSCLIICLDVVIIPRFPLVDKSFPKKNYFCREAEPLSHAARASSPFRGAFLYAAPQKPQSHLSVSHILIAINLGLPLCDVFIVLRQPLVSNLKANQKNTCSTKPHNRNRNEIAKVRLLPPCGGCVSSGQKNQHGDDK